METKYIIVSIARGYGTHFVDRYDCGLKRDLTFDPDLNLAKQFDSKEEATQLLSDLGKERKFSRNFYIKEIIAF